MSSPSPGDPSASGRLGALVRGVFVLALVVLAFAGITRACSFSPTTSEIDRASLPRIDVPVALRAAAPSVPFGLRVPVLPPDWIAQSSDVTLLGPRTDPASPRAVRVGWVTPDDRFLRLVQSNASEQELVVAERGDPVARGAVPAAGRSWVLHTGVRGEAIWVTDADGVRLLVTGDASPQRFTELAVATLAGGP